MITKQKIQIFERCKGDRDEFARMGSDKEKELFENHDWFLIDSFLQDIELINKGLSSVDYITQRIAEMKASCDEESFVWFDKKISSTTKYRTFLLTISKRSRFINLTGLVCGAAPLVGGLIIFFIWWAGRAFFAEDLDDLESIGFVWNICSFLMATFGLVRSIRFIIKGDRTTRLKSWMGLLLILLNIPVVMLVGYKQEDIAKRAYIKIYNHTKHDNVEVIIQGWDFEYQLGVLDDNESLVGYYYPKYLNDDPTDSSPIPLDVNLILKDEFFTHYLELPSSIKGDCESIYIDKDFRLLDESYVTKHKTF
jgi:hypothetical protein